MVVSLVFSLKASAAVEFTGCEQQQPYWDTAKLLEGPKGKPLCCAKVLSILPIAMCPAR